MSKKKPVTPPVELLELFPEQRPEDMLSNIPTDQIDVSDFVQPTPEFIESVRKLGVIQPVLLCKKSEKSERYEVLAGRRRVLAARIVGLEFVPAIYRYGIDYASARASALTIEAQRHFNPNPVAEYKAVRKLIDGGYSMERICSSLGITSERMEKLLTFSTLPDTLLDAVQDRKVAVSTAETLAKMSAPQKQKAVAKFKSSGVLTGPDLVDIKSAHKTVSSQDVMAQMESSKSNKKTVADQVSDLKRPVSGPVDLSDESISRNDVYDAGFEDGWNRCIEAVLRILDV